MAHLILVTFAVPEEARPFRARIAHHQNLEIHLTGIGPHRARSALEAVLTSRRPTAVLTCGFAGGLNPSLRRGEIVIDTSAARQIESALCDPDFRPVRFYTAERVASTALEKAALHQATKADAIEMESGVIRLLCLQRDVPCAIVRVISDAADEDLPLDFNRYLNRDGQLVLRRLVTDVAVAPWRWARLLRFQRSTREVADKLASSLVRVVGRLQAA